jgi:ribosomal protein S18 acetylase RimI-like enzyme
MSDPWLIRPAAPADAEILAHLHVQGWRDSYAGLVDQSYLDSLSESDRAEKWREWLRDSHGPVLLAFDAEKNPAGFVNFGKLRTPLPGQSAIRPLYTGEIYAIYILAAYWRRGLGRALMRQAAEGLAAMKHKSLCLWVLDGNERAIGFYKALGGQRCGKKQIEIGGRMRTELCFGWRDTASLRA